MAPHAVHLDELIPTAFLVRWGYDGATRTVYTPSGVAGIEHAASFVWDGTEDRKVRVALPCGAMAVDVALHGETSADLINEAENLLRDLGWEWRAGNWWPRASQRAEHRISMLDHIANSPLKGHAPGAHGSAERSRFFALAMCGEAGECANQFKKDWRGDPGDRRAAQIEELAGTIIYAIRLAHNMGLDPIAIAYGEFLTVEQRPEMQERLRGTA